MGPGGRWLNKSGGAGEASIAKVRFTGKHMLCPASLVFCWGSLPGVRYGRYYSS